ncbi:MAG: TRAM domain-containing protein [Candidatus Nanopelagicales bacterium]
MIDLQLDSPADGGACVGRADGQVVFARHGLPGEHVGVEVQAQAKRFLRADVVRVSSPNPQRVASPCPYFRPGGCGGCAWLHADPDYQLELKGQVADRHVAAGSAASSGRYACARSARRPVGARG